ncbi:MAG: L-2-hydroxyglutarate oxidase [Lewinellaceae bacterium]|nr:L-2-hydroxyglutarate oxidase [Lewinellaceae bacterium]
MKKPYDSVIVGAGIVGLATAYQLILKNPGLSLCIIEKEERVGAHQSTHNSGVLHAGLYYKPGSQKARLSVSGIRQMVQFCERYDIPHEICGKLVVATDESEKARLEKLLERGQANGLKGLKWLGPDAMREIEPNVAGVAAIRVPEEGIVDYQAVVLKLAELLNELGVTISLGTSFVKATEEGQNLVIQTNKGAFYTKRMISCGGLYSDRIVQNSNLRPTARIIPFRGEYYVLREDKRSLVNHLIYPVPDPKFPFLGVHFTRLIHGGVEAGPNAVLAVSREGYSWKDLNVKDLMASLTFPGLWRFIRKYPGMCAYEVYRSLSKSEFARSLQKLVPAIEKEDLLPGGAGVRAQAMYSDGALVDDFHFAEAPNMLHVVNAPSPAATAALAIGETIAERFMSTIQNKKTTI